MAEAVQAMTGARGLPQQSVPTMSPFLKHISFVEISSQSRMCNTALDFEQNIYGDSIFTLDR